MVVQGPLRHYNQPVAYIDKDGSREKVSGHDISTAAYQLQQSAGKTKELISTVLLNTTGGFVAIGHPVLSAVGYFEYHDRPTTAFVDQRAMSYGGTIFTHCAQRVSKVQSKVMLHQTYQYRGEREKMPKHPPLSAPREQFRQELLGWLEANVSEEYRNWALGRAKLAFADRRNYLDDVEFIGQDLYRAGVVQRVTQNRADLAQAYAETTRSTPEAWPRQIQAFFGL